MAAADQRSRSRLTKIPTKFVFFVVAVCVLPFLLNRLGVDFGSGQMQLDGPTLSSLPVSEFDDALFSKLSGAFSHTLLEWSAFCTAIFTVVLAFVHYSLRRDWATPVIGVALFFAGCMDAFHTLAAARLTEHLKRTVGTVDPPE